MSLAPDIPTSTFCSNVPTPDVEIHLVEAHLLWRSLWEPSHNVNMLSSCFVRTCVRVKVFLPRHFTSHFLQQHACAYALAPLHVTHAESFVLLASLADVLMHVYDHLQAALMDMIFLFLASPDEALMRCLSAVLLFARYVLFCFYVCYSASCVNA